MDVTVLIVILLVVLLVAALGYALYERRRSQRLKEDFGPEYERVIERSVSRRHAETELRRRKKRREQLDIRDLRPEQREHFAREWDKTQADFVDAPERAMSDANRLVGEVLLERGYPSADFEQRAADISVDHPKVVEDYREAHRISEASERGDISTEDQRQALMHYRALFELLLRSGEDESSRARRA